MKKTFAEFVSLGFSLMNVSAREHNFPPILVPCQCPTQKKKKRNFVRKYAYQTTVCFWFLESECFIIHKFDYMKFLDESFTTNIDNQLELTCLISVLTGWIFFRMYYIRFQFHHQILINCFQLINFDGYECIRY